MSLYRMHNDFVRVHVGQYWQLPVRLEWVKQHLPRLS